MFLRQLEYLTVLAREGHFGRAAQECQVSQPALSAAIRKLEAELGVPLIQRHHRFDGLTPEGETLLHWAREVQTGVTALTTEAAQLRGDLSGTLRLGVIPTALSVASLIAGPVLRRHPGMRLEVRSLSSREIERRLIDFELDAAVTYTDNEPLGDVDATPVYTERYVLLSPEAEGAPPTVGWAELHDLPLCLLTPDMQHRRIIDAALQEADVEPAPRVEANSISALLSFARAGWSCVTAHTWLAMQGPPSGMQARALTDPAVTHDVGLVTRQVEVHPPLVRALRDTIGEIDVDAAAELTSAPG